LGEAVDFLHEMGTVLLEQRQEPQRPRMQGGAGELEGSLQVVEERPQLLAALFAVLAAQLSVRSAGLGLCKGTLHETGLLGRGMTTCRLALAPSCGLLDGRGRKNCFSAYKPRSSAYEPAR